MTQVPQAVTGPLNRALPGANVSATPAGANVTLNVVLPHGSTCRATLDIATSQRLRAELERCEAAAARYKRGDYDLPSVERTARARAEHALPRDWRVDEIGAGTPYADEPTEMIPPGVYLAAGFTDDPEDGPGLILQVERWTHCAPSATPTCAASP